MPRSGGPSHSQRRSPTARFVRAAAVGSLIGVLAAPADLAHGQEPPPEVPQLEVPSIDVPSPEAPITDAPSLELDPLDIEVPLAEPPSAEAPSMDAAPSEGASVDPPSPEVGSLETPYEDHYLAESDASIYDLDAGLTAEPLGLRRLAAEFVYYTSEDKAFGDELEQGVRASFRRETSVWGTFDLEAQVADVESDYFGREAIGTDGVITLRQSAMPVSEIAMLDTVVGHQRTVLDSLLHGGYHYRLPTSPLLGASGELSLPEGAWRFAMGKVGEYRGIALPRFEETGGELTTVAYERRLSDNLELGGEIVSLREDDDIRDHTSALFGAKYTMPSNRHEHFARLMTDDDGNVGLWTDSRTELRAAPLRYGIFYFDAELAWTDEPIANDQMGVYLRADLSKYRYRLSTGYDYLETGVNGHLTPSTSHSVFASGHLRISRDISVGFNGDFGTRSYSGAFPDDQFLWRTTAYVTVRTLPGDARFEVSTDELDSDSPGNRQERNGVRAAFDWRMPQRVRLTTELGMERYDDIRGTTHRDEISVWFRYDVLNNVSLGLNTSLYRARGSVTADDGVSINADARWAFLPRWQATLSLTRNGATLDAVDPLFLNRTEFGNDSVWLTVGYARSAGRSYPLFGHVNGTHGNGAVIGEVFFDENRDGIRQPSEQAAAGAVVVLDGRYEARTDEQGRYYFSPVPTGTHEIAILTEELPLPWGLDDETPRQVRVSFRDTALMDFALVVTD